MRKTLFLAIGCTVAILLGGCSNNGTESRSSSSASAVKSSSSEMKSSSSEKSSSSSEKTSSVSEVISSVSSPETKTFSFDDIIPSVEEYFPDATVDVNGDPSCEYFASVSGVKYDECNNYITACKEMGFTNIDFDIAEDDSRYFEAFTEDKQFYLEVQFINDDPPAAAICCYKEK